VARETTFTFPALFESIVKNPIHRQHLRQHRPMEAVRPGHMVFSDAFLKYVRSIGRVTFFTLMQF
jgi:hypothetical protein